MKNGFTLIELLAVIVILAIIALIVVPIVLNIINDAKESSLLQSAEFYLDAVEYTIANSFLYHGGLDDGEYTITLEGNICKVNETPCKEENVLKVEVNGDKPTGGFITIDGGIISDVQLVLSERVITKNEENELVYSICRRISGEKNTIGSKYECEVKPGTKYNFYVLSKEDDGTTNLIMDRNICEDGTPTNSAKEDKCYFDLCYDYSITEGVEVLNNITRSWSNVNNLNITYNDAGGNYTNLKLTGKARMPFVSEVTSSFLFDNLHAECRDPNNGNYVSCDILSDDERFGVFEEGIEHIDGIYGYWTLDTDDYEQVLYRVYYEGYTTFTGDTNSLGLRPVINLKL